MLEPNSYRPTAADRLWLLRAVEGEGTPKRVVAQTMVNRFMWLRERNPDMYTTLADFVRAYSQPVNPRWQRGGDKFEAAWKRADEDTRRTLLALDRRRKRHSERTSFDASTVDAVDRALTMGPVDLPTPDTTDFAARHVTAGGHLVQTADLAQTFYRVRGSDWQGYSVGEGRGTLATAAGVVAVAVVVLWAVKRG